MDQNWSKWLKKYLVHQRDKQDHHSTQFKALSINLTYKVQMLAKGGYIWPKMIKFLPILFNFGWFFGQNWPNLTCSRPVYVLFMQNSNSWLETVWKNGLVWLSRPLDKVLAIWANFGPLRAKISKIAGETPTFYWSPRLYLPIGIQNCPCFCWRISSHFWLGSKSQ